MFDQNRSTTFTIYEKKLRCVNNFTYFWLMLMVARSKCVVHRKGVELCGVKKITEFLFVSG